MPGLRIAAIVTAVVALAVAPAAAEAAVASTQITGWTSQNPATPPNNPYLISFDNPPNATTVTVTGDAPGASNTDQVDVVCYFGAAPSVARLAGPVAIHNGTWATGAVPLKSIAGHACRLRAIPANGESAAESDNFAAQQVAVSEAALPISISSGTNAGAPFNFYVNDVTLAGYAVWSAAGTPSASLPTPYTAACGGPEAAPIDPAFDVGNFAIDCAGSLLSDDLGIFGGRSEVQVDGRNAYDPAAAQSLFTSGTPASQNLPGFPKTLAASVDWDPTTGLIASDSTEPWVECSGPNSEKPTSNSCPSFVDSHIQLERDITTGDGGRVAMMTDTWSSTDGRPHTVDLLYDDAVGVGTDSTGDRGYEFPGQTAFSQYGTGNTLPGPSSVPGSILVRTNVTATDGDPSEAAGAITFGTAPSGFAFTANNDFEEHHILVVPASGSSLSYVYSVGYLVGDVQGLALVAQDHIQGPALVITTPANGTTVSNPTATLSGTATSGSGITSLSVGGHPVSVGPGGAWSAQVTLSPGTSTITAQAIDRAGESANAQISVVYSPPPPPGTCKVPKTRGTKVRAAETALRRAHCRVGKIKHVRSRTIHSGRVMSTTPRAGRILRAATKVELWVSKGS
jgi:hypothetical protein